MVDPFQIGNFYSKTTCHLDPVSDDFFEWLWAQLVNFRPYLQQAKKSSNIETHQRSYICSLQSKIKAKIHLRGNWVEVLGFDANDFVNDEDLIIK